jgi:hypothetical protein
MATERKYMVLSKENMERLIRVKGRMEMESGVKHTREDTVVELIEFYEEHKNG